MDISTQNYLGNPRRSPASLRSRIRRRPRSIDREYRAIIRNIMLRDGFDLYSHDMGVSGAMPC
jgi:hypothetical protein